MIWKILEQTEQQSISFTASALITLIWGWGEGGGEHCSFPFGGGGGGGGGRDPAYLGEE